MNIDYSILNAPITDDEIIKYRGKTYKSFKTRNLLIFVTVLVVWAIIVGARNDSLVAFIGILLIPGVSVGAFLYYSRYASHQIARRQAIIQRFAEANSCSAVFSVKNPEKLGMIFNAGHTKELEELIVLHDGTEIGNHRYVTGSGKNSQTHYFSYIAIKLPRKLPHMVLDSKSNNFFGISNLPTSFNRGQQLQLEGDFNKYFDVYVPEGYERDALYVFTPDIMQMMMNSSLYDIEIIEDSLYIYGKKIDLTNSASLRKVIEQIQKINQKFDRRVDYYMDERVESREANVVAPGGSKLKKGVPWAIVIFVGIVILLQVVPFMINFLTIIFISN